MERIYTIAKAVLEIIYLISAPLVALFAWKALQQIKIGACQVAATREATEVAAQRESFRLAAEQAKVYADEIIPLLAKFHDLKKNGDYPVLSACEITEEWPTVQSKTNNWPQLIAEVVSHDGLVVQILNRMESIAMFFVCGVADADKAYRPLSANFCDHVRHFLPYVVFAYKQKKQFTYTLMLFGAWGMRDHKEKAEQEIAAKQEQLAKVTVPDFPTIGTKQDKVQQANTSRA